MPQGPTSRGCEACRAQKKKCDLAQPACSRCKRLRITCVGCGQQRYAFSSYTKTATFRRHIDNVPSLSTVPSNRTTHLQQDVVKRLQASDDLRYFIGFRYGSWLRGIPRRLGSDSALDAAIVALLARHSETSLRQDQSDPRAPSVTKYNLALVALRTNLSKADKLSSPDTLCAAMVLMYCQVRFDDQFSFFWSPHAQGIAYLLRMRNFQMGEDSFNIDLFGPLSSFLVLQSFANPEIRLSPLEYRKLKEIYLNAPKHAPDLRFWQMMILMSELMTQARDAVAVGSCLDTLAIKANLLHKSMQNILTSMHDRLRTLETESSDQPLDIKLHASCQRGYGVALAVMAKLLCMQRTLSPQDVMLEDVAANTCCEILLICEEARVYRPVGAVWTVHSLICAWCATQDLSLRIRVEGALLDYQKDAMGPNAEFPVDKLKLLERRLSLLE